MENNMIKVVCCICDIVVYLKPGNGNDVSHGFCQECLNGYCKEMELEPIEIFAPEGAIVNYAALPHLY